jgi:alpha-beta hydrolase superfamily lysophospholipase
MRRFGKGLGRTLLALAMLIGLVAVFGPREPAPLAASFDPRKFGEGVQVYFETPEAAFDDITPGVEKHVVWQPGFKEQRTRYSVLYVHGFSATAGEIRPVPDMIAEALGANLVYTRLQGHGRGPDAMGEATVAGWMQDMAEALAAARAVGEQVIVISTSTGGTLVVPALLDEQMREDVAAAIFVSPNFAVNDPFGFLLTWPFARQFVPLAIGETRSFTPANAEQATYWTNSYPSTAVLPMAALVKAVDGLDVTQIAVPAQFWISDADQVVKPEATRAVAARWGGVADLRVVTMGPGDDPSSHVIAGGIMSPGQTEPTVQGMLAWLAKQGIE